MKKFLIKAFFIIILISALVFGYFYAIDYIKQKYPATTKKTKVIKVDAKTIKNNISQSVSEVKASKDKKASTAQPATSAPQPVSEPEPAQESNWTEDTGISDEPTNFDY